MLNSIRRASLVSLRHWLVYKKYFLSNILPTFLEPCFFILSLGVGLGSYVSQLDGRTYAEYMGPGLATGAALFTAFFDSSYGFYVRYRMDGIYKAIMTTPLSVNEIILGELMWVSVKGAFMSTAVSLVFVVFGILPLSFNIITLMYTGALVGLGCGALGLISSGLIRNISQFQTVYTLLISPLFFFSGIFFPLEKLPYGLKKVAIISPVYHGVKMNQMLLWQEFDTVAFTTHSLSLLGINLICLYFACRLIRRRLYI